MRLGSWPDGSAVEGDPSKDDPLYYYVTDGNWSTAIGFQVTPAREEARASTVMLSVWPSYRALATQSSQSEQAQMYLRTVEALGQRFRNWTEIKLIGCPFEIADILAAALPQVGWNAKERTINFRELVLTRVDAG